MKRNKIFYSLCTNDIRSILETEALKLNEHEIKEIESKFEMDWYEALYARITDYISEREDRTPNKWEG